MIDQWINRIKQQLGFIWLLEILFIFLALDCFVQLFKKNLSAPKEVKLLFRNQSWCWLHHNHLWNLYQLITNGITVIFWTCQSLYAYTRLLLTQVHTPAVNSYRRSLTRSCGDQTWLECDFKYGEKTLLLAGRRGPLCIWHNRKTNKHKRKRM